MHFFAGLQRLAALPLLAATAALACGGGGSGGGSQPPPPEQLFVRQSGNDDNGGAAATDAYRTIAQAVANAVAGQTIYVGPGTYTVPRARFDVNSVDVDDIGGEGLRIVADREGSMTNDDPGDVIVNARDGFGFRISRSTNVSIEGFRIERARGNESAGIQVRSTSTGVEISDCVFTLNRDGVRIQGDSSALVFNNLFFDNNRGVRLNGSGEVQILHNTIVDSGARGISIIGSPMSTSVRNNILQDNANRNIEVDNSAVDTFESDFNLIYSTARNTDPEDTVRPSTLIGDNDVLEDALFVDASSNRPDYRLLAGTTGISPAIDAGDGTIDGILLSRLFTRATTEDGEADAPPIDLGYHLP